MKRVRGEIEQRYIHGYHVFRDGSAWCAVGPHFECLMTSTAGFGDTPEAAVEALREELGKETWWRDKSLPLFEKFTVHTTLSRARPSEAKSNDKEGWKEATIAWAVCASIHREYAWGKDPFFKTRQDDYVKHENIARARLKADVPSEAVPEGQPPSRDALYVDPILTEMALRNTERLRRRLDLDAMNAKEIYRTIVSVAVEFILARLATLSTEAAQKAREEEQRSDAVLSRVIDLLDDVIGPLDKQTYDRKRSDELGLPEDAELDVVITVGQERKLSEAWHLLSERLRAIRQRSGPSGDAS